MPEITVINILVNNAAITFKVIIKPFIDIKRINNSNDDINPVIDEDNMAFSLIFEDIKPAIKEENIKAM